MDDQFNKLRKATTDADEMTTSGDISYARGEMRTTTTPVEKDLLKDKSRKFNKDTESKMLRQLQVKEQHDAKVPRLKVGIMRKIDGIIGTSKLGMERFHQAFIGSVKDLTGTTKSLIRYQTIPDDLEKLEKSLPEDVGDLELISSALQNKRTIKNYEPFSDYDNLFVARMKADIGGVPIIYEGVVGTDYIASENLYIGDVDKAEEIADEVVGVKRVNKVLFPIGGIFDPDFFNTVKDIILTDKEEKKP